MSIALSLIVAALLCVALWSLLRRRRDQRRRRLTEWLAGGVEVFGGAAAIRRSDAGFEIRIDQTAPPFRTLALAARPDAAGLSLLPAPPGLRRRLLWRDRLVVRSELHRPPRAEFDFFFAETAEGHEAREAARAARWRVSEVGQPSPFGLGVLCLGEPGGTSVAPRDGLLAIARRIEELASEVRRVSVRLKPPHVVAVVAGPGATGQVTAQALFDLLREAAYLAQGPSRQAVGR